MTKIKNYVRGDSRPINISVVDSSGNPVNITGATVFFTLNLSNAPADDTSAAIQKSTTSHTNPALGLTTITLTNTDTQNLTPGTYYYDIQVKDASGNITSTIQDTFTVVADISRRIV